MRILVAACFLIIPALAAAQPQAPQTMFDRAEDSGWWVSGQLNVIEQAHPTFTSPYSGPNSLRGESETRVSRVLTLYTGLRLGHGWEVFVDVKAPAAAA